MPARNEPGKAKLAIEIEPELRRRIESAAAARGETLRDYVVAALRDALENTGVPGPSDDTKEWSRLSEPSFARDWNSDADAVYDELA
jgi:hypothetical protein